MPRASPIPILLLAGRDRRTTVVPGGGHVLAGYKAMDLKIGGRPILVHLIERLREAGGFDPIFVAGPAKVYAGLASQWGEGAVRLVDTDATFGENIRAGVEAILAEHPDTSLACITTDVLPEVAELRRLLDDFERHQPLHFWTVECRAEDDARLGRSAWKRRYRIRPEGEEKVVPTLPGHLILVDPRALRLHLLYRLFELAYRTRNRPTTLRRVYVIRKSLGMLLAADWKRLLRLRPPVITWGMVYNGLVVVKKLLTTGIDQREMEDRLYRIWVRTSYRRRHPERRGRVLVTDILSLGVDIDTEEEAEEIVERVEHAGQAP